MDNVEKVQYSIEVTVHVLFRFDIMLISPNHSLVDSVYLIYASSIYFSKFVAVKYFIEFRFYNEIILASKFETGKINLGFGLYNFNY